MRSDAPMRSKPKRDVAVGRPIDQDFVGSLEFLFVVIGGQPADDNPVVAPKMLSANDTIARHGAAQLLVDREVPQKFICRAAVEFGMINEPLPQVGMGAEV